MLANTEGEKEEEEEEELSIMKALKHFSQEEKLEQENSWYCTRCKEHMLATKKMDLWRLPNCLIVHLKRFAYSGNYRDKIEGLVTFPIRYLFFYLHLVSSWSP